MTSKWRDIVAIIKRKTRKYTSFNGLYAHYLRYMRIHFPHNHRHAICCWWCVCMSRHVVLITHTNHTCEHCCIFLLPRTSSEIYDEVAFLHSAYFDRLLETFQMNFYFICVRCKIGLWKNYSTTFHACSSNEWYICHHICRRRSQTPYQIVQNQMNQKCFVFIFPFRNDFN